MGNRSGLPLFRHLDFFHAPCDVSPGVDGQRRGSRAVSFRHFAPLCGNAARVRGGGGKEGQRGFRALASFLGR